MQYNGSDKHKQALFEGKQDKLTAGTGITLTPLQDGTVKIEAEGGSGGDSIFSVVDGKVCITYEEVV